MDSEYATGLAPDPSDEPPAAGAYYYLIRLRNECGAGSYGQATDGVPREPLNGCP